MRLLVLGDNGWCGLIRWDEDEKVMVAWETTDNNKAIRGNLYDDDERCEDSDEDIVCSGDDCDVDVAMGGLDCIMPVAKECG
jgi:hypothetical protein